MSNQSRKTHSVVNFAIILEATTVSIVKNVLFYRSLPHRRVPAEGPSKPALLMLMAPRDLGHFSQAHFVLEPTSTPDEFLVHLNTVTHSFQASSGHDR